jgi:hypothetical protein
LISAIHPSNQQLHIRELVQKRIYDLGGEAFDSDSLGYLLVIKAGDTIEAIREQVGFNILHNKSAGIHYSDTDFTPPSFEFVEEITTCYDIVFVIDDGGYGVEIFVPKGEGVDSDLLAMCRIYAFEEDAP